VILVDSSVWIDFLRGTLTPEASRLDDLLAGGEETLLVGDLILMEVLRGCRSDREYERVLRTLSSLECVTLGGRAKAVKAAEHYRALLRRGVTVSRSVDLLIATWCIEERCPLLHADRDFEAFAALGLRFA
jgi:predicted nucleic acid-binding protein